MAMDTSRKQVIIVGGSIAGLMHGIMLKHHQYNVRILEMTPRSLEAQAAGVGTGLQTKDFMAVHDRLKSTFAFPSPGMRTMDATDQVIDTIPRPMWNTSWDGLYFRLRANFDGFTSNYCPHPPPHDLNDGEAVYDTGKRVVSISEGGDKKITVRYEDVHNGSTHAVDADLVIGADGSNSTVRSIVCPTAPKRRYAGYVLWRGLALEKELPALVWEKCSSWVTFYPSPQTRDFVVMYGLPGRNGSLQPGEGEMNFAWYARISSFRLEEALTDIDGHKHRWSVPTGKLNPDVWAKQLQHAGALNAHCQEVARKVQRPFLQVVSDYTTSQAAFYDGRVLLVGGALATMRPHTGTSISQAAACALELEKALFESDDVDKAIREWDRRVVEFTREETLRARSWGEWWVGGWTGWIPAALEYHGLVLWKKWSARIAGLVGL